MRLKNIYQLGKAKDLKKIYLKGGVSSYLEKEFILSNATQAKSGVILAYYNSLSELNIISTDVKEIYNFIKMNNLKEEEY